MPGTLTANWWQYSRWLWVIDRSMRINNPITAELTATETFIKTFWDVATSTGTRPWLQPNFQHKAASQIDTYKGDPDVESTPIDVKMLGVIARDVKKIPLTDAEKTACDTFFIATGNRRYGFMGTTI